MSCHFIVMTDKDFKCELIDAFVSQSPVLKLDNSYM